MLNKLRRFCKEQDLIHPGDRIICAVSGGADSMALLWAMYLLKEEWQLDLAAVHFNHHLLEEEPDQHEAFVRSFCEGYGIPLYVGSGHIVSGKKGLEAAARDARYAYFKTLDGSIATAHTADDNAETVLMHLVRGTGLKGLGGITPRNGSIIRPMLSITRAEVLQFLEEYAVEHVEDSLNAGDRFLRNRIRHHVMPVLKAENPKFSENVSAMALRLRQDEQALAGFAEADPNPDIPTLRAMVPAVRSRALESILRKMGLAEPESVHIQRMEELVFSDNPSAKADLPGMCVRRSYNKLEKVQGAEAVSWTFSQAIAETIENTPTLFTIKPVGEIRVRSRQSGDQIRLPGGSRSVKKLFIDRKIPAHQRESIPILVDDLGILGIPGIGVNLDRAADALPAVRIEFTVSTPASAVQKDRKEDTL